MTSPFLFREYLSDLKTYIDEYTGICLTDEILLHELFAPRSSTIAASIHWIWVVIMVEGLDRYTGLLALLEAGVAVRPLPPWPSFSMVPRAQHTCSCSLFSFCFATLHHYYRCLSLFENILNGLLHFNFNSGILILSIQANYPMVVPCPCYPHDC